MKPAFSTVACPTWTLSRIAEVASRVGALGVELRTAGDGCTMLACEPAHTSPEKVRSLFDSAGVVPFCLATSLRFDAPIFPPVLGRVFSDTEASIRAGKSAIDLARELFCPWVRVFAFERHGDECMKTATARIVERLVKVLDHCRNTGVKLLIENGGSFPTATALAELIDRCGSPLLYAAYSPSVAALAGETARNGINVLADRLVSVKLRDLRGGKACAIGRGDLHADRAMDALVAAGFDGWVVAELDTAWLPAPAADTPARRGKGRPVGESAAGPGPDVEGMLAESMRFIYERMGSRHEAAQSSPPAVAAR